ncbi:hypothetical protein ACLKOZ_20330 [Arthrobacter sp. R4]|uniref:hypothetical protein n=1 Tax=Arthrobacter sp. R4 TaxID=644417 RepID=UPI003ED9DAB5
MIEDYQAVAENGGALLVWRGRSLLGMLITKIEEDAVLKPKPNSWRATRADSFFGYTRTKQ